MLIKSKSLTHTHIRNCIATLLKSKNDGDSIKILDAGCGNGELVIYLYKSLQYDFPKLKIDIYGFDVVDHGVQSAGFLNATISMLHEVSPEVEWRERILLFSVDEKWNFESNHFDFIASNQVLEHVQDKSSFLQNVYRCLKTGGYSFHLAPLIHCVHEGHIWIPFAHRIRSYDFLYSYIKICSRLGIGKFRSLHHATGISLDDYTRRHADYMMFWTSYSTQCDTLDVSRKAGLRCDFRFTREFYILKILQILRIRLPTFYQIKQSAFLNAVSILLLRYVSSVTLTLQKGNDY
jgi:SAM-dependent methyltransferase